MCPECDADLDSGEDRQVEVSCPTCGNAFPVIDGRVCFYGLNSQQAPRTAVEPQNPANWTAWRRLNFEWYRSALGRVPKGASLVDVGAGDVQFQELMKDFETCHIDFMPYPNVQVITDLNRKLPLRANAFDVAVLSNVLEHIPEPQALLDDLHRVLGRGGRLLMVTPFQIKEHQQPYDFLRYTRFMFERMLTSASFREIRIEPLGNVFDVYDLVSLNRRKLLLRRMYASRARYYLWRFADLAARFAEGMAMRAVSRQIRCAPDTEGYPLGYACSATK